MDERLRPLRRDHLPLLAALTSESRPGLDPSAVHAAMESGRQAGDRFLVLEERGELRGFAWFAPRGAFGRPVLRELAVAPGARGRGLGAVLLAGVLEEAARTGRDLFLLLRADDDRARGFARHHGFEEVGPLPSFPGPGADSSLLRRRIDLP